VLAPVVRSDTFTSAVELFKDALLYKTITPVLEFTSADDGAPFVAHPVTRPNDSAARSFDNAVKGSPVISRMLDPPVISTLEVRIRAVNVTTRPTRVKKAPIFDIVIVSNDPTPDT
jgi:hypothetical protein